MDKEVVKRLSYVELEKEVKRLSKLLKTCEKKYNKQMVVYDRNMENLGKKMMEFEKSLLQEQLSIQKMLKEKDGVIESKNDVIKQLESVVENLQSTQCKCNTSSRQESIESSDSSSESSSVITLPPLNLPAKVPLQNVGFTNHRPFRPKSKLSPVAEESELTFSSTLRHVHADTNPEQFHALLTSRLLGSGLDELNRKNVTPVESFDSCEKLNILASESSEDVENVKVSETRQPYLAEPILDFSTKLCEDILTDALAPVEMRQTNTIEKNTKSSLSIFDEFSSDIARQVLFTASRDFEEYTVNAVVVSERDCAPSNAVEASERDCAPSNVVEASERDCSPSNLVEGSERDRSPSLPYDTVSVALVRDILDEVELELNMKDYNETVSVDTVARCDRANHIQLEESNLTENPTHPSTTQQEGVAKVGKPNISKEVGSSSGSFDEAIEKTKVNTETSKTKKKKKKKKKKRKNNLNNVDKNTPNDLSCDDDVTQHGNHDNSNKNVTAEHLTSAKDREEDKFSLLVDESLNNLDDLSDEVTIETNGPVNSTTEKFMQSCSFEDLSSLVEKNSTEEKNADSTNSKIDVSEYEVLS